MKEKKTAKDNNNLLNNNTKQSTMENYKLTATHNVFNTSFGHNTQKKEDYLKQQVVNPPPKKMPDYHKMSVSELKVSVKFFSREHLSKNFVM